MRSRIGTRLILGAGLATALAIGGMAVAVLRTHSAQLMAERTRSADQLSETIKSATHFDMLENRRDNLHRQIQAVGGLSEQGIRTVRVFNKEGRVMFSSSAEEIGTSLEIRGEACYVCHAEGKPLEHLEQTLKFKNPIDATLVEKGQKYILQFKPNICPDFYSQV